MEKLDPAHVAVPTPAEDQALAVVDAPRHVAVPTAMEFHADTVVDAPTNVAVEVPALENGDEALLVSGSSPPRMRGVCVRALRCGCGIG